MIKGRIINLKEDKIVSKTITVLDPTAKPKVTNVPMAPRVRDLNGKAIGFFWNTKPNADILLLRIQEQLSQRFLPAGTNWYQKQAASIAAEDTTINELVNTSDLVIIAIGD
jgi:hypothetical protein